jgi:cell division protein FtsQ
MAEPVVAGRRANVAARRRRVAVIVAVPVLAVVLLGLLSFTPLFGAKEILVEGNVALSADAVASLAGVEPGTNVVHLDTETATQALESDPWVQEAVVSRDLPTTIVVRVIERAPVARSGADVVAADGTILPGATGEGLPSIAARVGDVTLDQRSSAAAVAGALAPVVRNRVDTVLVEPDDDLLLLLDDGVAVFYGAPGQEVAKAEALRALLRWAEGESIDLASADVSVPSAPTARPAGGDEVTPP